MIGWLMSPIDPSRAHEVGWLLSWHARAMVAGWAILVPLGIIVARYFKVTPGQKWPRELDSRFWWNTHRAVQYGAGLAMLIGLTLALTHSEITTSLTQSAWLHRWLGWTVLTLGAAQFVSAWLRGSKGGPTDPAPDGSWHGDHYDMTRRRVIFERYHKFCGLVAAVLAIATVLSGLWQLNAPRWMWFVLSLWWAGLALVIAWLEQRIGALDTYQAIWGNARDLPGLERPPIGIRVRRRSR